MYMGECVNAVGMERMPCMPVIQSCQCPMIIGCKIAALQQINRVQLIENVFLINVLPFNRYPVRIYWSIAGVWIHTWVKKTALKVSVL